MFNQVKLTMARIKQVLWERRIAWLQAQEILKRETERQELLASGQKEEELSLHSLKLEEINSIGRKEKRKLISSRGNRKPKDNRSTSWTVV
jgi:hypothetical protein